MPRLHLTSLAALTTLVLLSGSACLFGGEDESGDSTGVEATPTRAARTSALPTTTPGSNDPVDGAVTVTHVLPFIWPVDGLITSAMGPEHPDGIDIAFEPGGSLNVRAAAGGVVIRAGGSDDEDLGLSVALDHGNGITTVYGHLSELRVREGSEVAIGETIGVGGSTGISNGVHLHFEVRKDGQTVDPEDVLPAGVPDTAVEDLDCNSESFTIPAGSRTQVDFAGLLDESAEITSARAVSLGSGRGLGPTIQTRSKLLLSTPIDFDTPDLEERYRLEVTVDEEGDERTLTCSFAIRHRQVSTTFYARATATPEPQVASVEEPVQEVGSVQDVDGSEPANDANQADAEQADDNGDQADDNPEAESVEPSAADGDADPTDNVPPTLQPTAPPPTPTSEAGPSYSAPSFTGPVAQPPSVQQPGGASGPGASSPGGSSPGAQQPSYNTPGEQ